LYEGAVALRASVNFRKDLRGSKPWGDSRRSRWGRRLWRQDRRQDPRYDRKTYRRDLLYERPKNSLA